MDFFEKWVENDSSEIENYSDEEDNDAQTIIVNDIKQENLESEFPAGKVCPESQTVPRRSRQQR